MRGFIESILGLRVLVAVLAVTLVVFGVARLGNLPMGLLPEYDPPVVRVQTEALGLSPAEVEQFITAPLEQDLLNGVAFLRTITSTSVPGLSVVDMEFEPGTDIFVARQVVQERLTQAHALPNVSSPPQMIQPVSSTGRVMMIGLTSDEVSLIDMSLLARWTIKSRLVGVPGVSNVSIWGMRDRQLQILVDPADLQRQNVSLRNLVETSANALWTSPLGFVEASTPGTGGWIETPNQRLPIQHELPINTAFDLGRVVFERPTDAPSLTISDVAEVVEDHQPLIGDASFDGTPGLMIVVEKSPWANTRDVTRDLERALEELRPGLVGINVDAEIYRPADFIQAASDNLSISVLLGSFIGLLALIACLWDWRLVLSVAVAVPLSLMATVIVVVLMGQTVNVILLAGLAAALVIVIDSAIADTHGLTEQVDPTADGSLVLRQIAEATTQTRASMFFVVTIVVLAMLPAIFLSGTAAALFDPIVWAVGVGAVAALIVAMTVTPVLSWALFTYFPGPIRQSSILAAIGTRYEGILTKALQMRGPAMLGAGGLAVLAVILVPLLKHDNLVPRIHEPGLLIDVQTAPGTSIPEMLRLTTELTNGLSALPAIKDVGAHVGRSLVGDQIVGVNSGQIWVKLADGADYDTTFAEIRDVMAKTPDITTDLSAYSKTGLDKALQPPRSDLVVRLYGVNPDVLAEQTEVVRNAISGVEGLGDLAIEQTPTAPVLEIKVQLEEAARAGITPGDVRRTASILLSGLIVGQFFESQKVFDVVIWGKPDIRSDSESIRALLIDTPSGNQVRLGDVAEVTVVDRPEQIKREASSRYIDITGNVDGRDLVAVEADVQTILRDLALPYEYHAAVQGAGADIRAAQSRTISIVVAAVIGAFLVLQAAVGSWRRAFWLTVAVLASMSGAVVAALLIGDVTLGVYAGLLAVFGLAVSQGVMGFRATQDTEDGPSAAFGVDLVHHTALDRLAPVVTVAAALILFFGVLAFWNDAPGFVLIAPFTMVVLLGTLTTVFTILVLLPALLLAAGPRPAAEPMDIRGTTGQPKGAV
jgi:Cu/Ag efflux pump CusA